MLARWFTKTAVVLNTAQNYRLMIPRGVRHAVKHGVPRDMAVYLARMPGASKALGFNQQAGQVIGVVDSDKADQAPEYLQRAYVCVLQIEGRRCCRGVCAA